MRNKYLSQRSWRDSSSPQPQPWVNRREDTGAREAGGMLSGFLRDTM